MKHEEKTLRSAIDARLGALTADPCRRARIRQAISMEEKPNVKRKLLTSLAIGLLTILLTGAALAVGFNLFAYFGETDPRMAKLAPDAVLEEAPAASVVESDPLGQTCAAINSAYYDGQSLLVGYIIQNGTHCEAFTPTAEQLAQMEPQAMLMMPAATAENAEILAQYRRAVEVGTPFGMVTYSVYPSDHTETEDGIDLPSSTETSRNAADGTLYSLREYETPLPEAAQDRDTLTLQIHLWQNAHYLYFDGSCCYTLNDRLPAEPMTATVRRTEGSVRVFSGEGADEDISVTVYAEASAISAHVTVTAAQPWPTLAEDTWYEVVLLDEAGRSCRMKSLELVNPQTLVISYEGTGSLPEQLTAYLLLCHDGEQPEEAAMKRAEPIMLTCLTE